ncbi:MAG: tRNA preQ1(34) S-adenosylmethionine ribosyltransferase-isomerase QueA [Bryobacterales bacterium]|nr:tRNA preQ1(34) S-adenosylmethionine ribosyltransferase-isomerase QueA [Bryobacterales bacterium]
MLVSEFDYPLPPELIAQEPLADRAASRMLVVDRASGTLADRAFRDLPGYLAPGDCLVVNDTRVFPARLFGHREGFEGQVQVFLVRAQSPDQLTWLCLTRPGRKMRTGEHIVFADDLHAEILGRNEHGERLVRFHPQGDLFTILDRLGHMPLPPYIHRADNPEDRERYQTVYASERGSVAAPTAGLHFTPEVLEACSRAGAAVARLTLHVGLGTFQPLHSPTVEEVKLHSEAYSIREDQAAILRAARRRLAVGTTSVRTLETAMRRGGFVAQSGDTDLFIYPGFEFRAVGAMLTNFHLPQSSLLMLVCAFAGKDLAFEAYHHAVRDRYRFFSYGDCMLIL